MKMQLAVFSFQRCRTVWFPCSFSRSDSWSGAIEVTDAGDSHGLEGYGQVSPCFGVEEWSCLSFV